MNKQLFNLVLVFLSFFLLSGCFGSNSGDGEGKDSEGEGTEELTTLEGEQGEQGDAGAAGLSCWDLNEDGVGDPDTEDKNEDGIVNALDCSVVCWDLNGDGEKDDDEDVNSDGVVDVYDCQKDCKDEDEDGFCDVVGVKALAAICPEGDPSCINGCEGGTLDTKKSCEKECEKIYPEPQIDCFEECGDYIEYDSVGNGHCVHAKPSCLEQCKDECAPFEIEKEECPEGYIIPDYYESKKISVTHCSVYHDVLVITENYMKFESFLPQTAPYYWIRYHCGVFGLGRCRKKKHYNDNFEVGFSEICENNFPEYTQKAIVKINGIPHKWHYPSVDYFEFIDQDMDRSEPMFVLPLKLSECPAQNIIKVPKIVYNHHRKGQLTFMFNYINKFVDHQTYYENIKKDPCLNETKFRIFYKAHKKAEPLLSDTAFTPLD